MRGNCRDGKKGLAGNGATALSLGLPAFPKNRNPLAQVWRLDQRISFRLAVEKDNPSPPSKQARSKHPAIEAHPGLSPSARNVYSAILSHCRPGRLYAWPSLATLAQNAQCSIRTVSRALDALEGHGLLTRMPVFRHGRRQGTVYRLKDLRPLIPHLFPAQTPKHYIPGKPVEKLSTPRMSTKPLPLPKGNPVVENPIPLSWPGPTNSVKLPTRRPTDGPQTAQERRSPRQTGKQPCQPKTPQEAAIWCEALDRGYSDLPGNRRRLRQILDKGGVELLRRLLDLSLRPWVKEPGAYLQRLVLRQLRA